MRGSQRALSPRIANYAMFLLRMVEDRRDKDRTNVVEDIRAICRKYGFKAELIGGVYYLQGRLAEACRLESRDRPVLAESPFYYHCVGCCPHRARCISHDSEPHAGAAMHAWRDWLVPYPNGRDLRRQRPMSASELRSIP
jgi:hypothetical protein